MYEVARRLAKQGHEIEYVCSGLRGMPSLEDHEGIRIRRMGSLLTTSPAFALRGRSLRGWADGIVEEVVGGLRVPYLSAAYADVPRTCFWYQRNAPIFVNQYGPAVGVPLGWMERVVARLYHSSHILTCSEQSRTDLIRLGLRSDRLRVYYPGLPDALFPLARANRGEHGPLLLTIGKFRRFKRLDHAILILARLVSIDPSSSARLVIAGRAEDARYERFMRDLAREVRVADRVSFELNVTEARKAELLRQAGVLLATAPVEGFGRTVIEANLFGVPAVGSSGIPPDVIREGFNGYRVPFGDIEAYARVVARLLGDEAEWRRISANARGFAQGFTWDETVKAVNESLNEMLG